MANLLVLISYKVFPPQMGGQKAVVLFYQQLAKHHGVHLAVSKDNAPIESVLYNNAILFPNASIWKNIFRLFALQKLVKQNNIDGIIAEHSYTGWLAYLLQKLTAKPFIIRSHNIEASRFKQMGRKGWRLYNLYEKWIHRKADHNFFISEADAASAIKGFDIEEANCSVLPYGINAFAPIANAKQLLRNKYNIESRYIFYFNGTHNYKPNEDAVVTLMQQVSPLLQKRNVDFTILISGTALRQELVEATEESKKLRYVGFADDVRPLYQGADLFVNPVTNNSGVKTKVVEALANHCTVISMQSGASGIPTDVCGDKLVCVADHNFEAFTQAILSALDSEPKATPAIFFERFSWDTIAEQASVKIQSIIDQHAG